MHMFMTNFKGSCPTWKPETAPASIQLIRVHRILSQRFQCRIHVISIPIYGGEAGKRYSAPKRPLAYTFKMKVIIANENRAALMLFYAALEKSRNEQKDCLYVPVSKPRGATSIISNRNPKEELYTVSHTVATRQKDERLQLSLSYTKNGREERTFVCQQA
jgi:hypothetical protein